MVLFNFDSFSQFHGHLSGFSNLAIINHFILNFYGPLFWTHLVSAVWLSRRLGSLYLRLRDQRFENFGTFEKTSEYIICNEVMRFGDVDFTRTDFRQRNSIWYVILRNVHQRPNNLFFTFKFFCIYVSAYTQQWFTTWEPLRVVLVDFIAGSAPDLVRDWILDCMSLKYLCSIKGPLTRLTPGVTGQCNSR